MSTLAVLDQEHSPGTGSTHRKVHASRGLLAWFALAWCVLMLAACGGGGGDSDDAPSSPAIQQYAADRPAYKVGESARLTVRFTGGTGRIEPGIGPVTSGATVVTPPLDMTTGYELIVESAAGSARRTLTLDVSYRNSYRVLQQPFPVAYHSSVLAADGSVVIIGGSRGQSAFSESIDRFDPATETFTKIGDLTGGPFDGATATRLPDGRILVTGARLLSGVSYAELIDERTGVATPTGVMSTPRMGHTATLLANGRVLITGGTSAEGYPGRISPTAETWDPQTGEFRVLAPAMRLPRVNHTATRLEDGRVLLVGGFSHTTPYLLAEIFDPQAETFEPVPSNDARGRALHESVLLREGHVLVVGGEDHFGTHHRSVLLWNRTAGVLEPMSDLLASRSLIRAAATRADTVLLFGGVTPEEPVADGSAESYTRLAGGNALPPMPVARAWHTVTKLRDGRVLILGGQREDGSLLAEALIYE